MSDVDDAADGERIAQIVLPQAIVCVEHGLQLADEGLLPKTDEARGRLQRLLTACRGMCEISESWPSAAELRKRLSELCDRLEPLARSPGLNELEQLYRRVMGSVDHDIPSYDFVAGRFAVRHWDGMDGCWSDVATDLSGTDALRMWSERTQGGTRQTRFDQIDYVRLFPGDTKMMWDGSPGREMFR